MVDIRTKEINIGDYKINIIRGDQHIGLTLFLGFEWDGWMRKDLPLLVKEGCEILDIGGNIGWNAIMFSEYAQVHTFEPVYYNIIEKNILENNLGDKITIHPYGLSKEENIVNFWIPSYCEDTRVINYGGTSIYPSPNFHNAGKFNVKKLDDVYFGTPCLLKIDVEGHELEVLQGAERVINAYKPHIYIEIFGFEKNPPVVELLKWYGYNNYIVKPEHNYLFINDCNYSLYTRLLQLQTKDPTTESSE